MDNNIEHYGFYQSQGDYLEKALHFNKKQYRSISMFIICQRWLISVTVFDIGQVLLAETLKKMILN